jgi:hypothetical protein
MRSCQIKFVKCVDDDDDDDVVVVDLTMWKQN